MIDRFQSICMFSLVHKLKNIIARFDKNKSLGICGFIFNHIMYVLLFFLASDFTVGDTWYHNILLTVFVMLSAT